MNKLVVYREIVDGVAAALLAADKARVCCAYDTHDTPGVLYVY